MIKVSKALALFLGLLRSVLFFWFDSLFNFFLLVLIKKQKIIIAHRGASGLLPEHTLEGGNGLSFGVDYIEPDIVLQKITKPLSSTIFILSQQRMLRNCFLNEKERMDIIMLLTF